MVSCYNLAGNKSDLPAAAVVHRHFVCTVDQVTEEPVITAMLAKYTEINKSKPTTSGWRVQVYATDRPGKH